MKMKWNGREYEGTPQELAEYGILQDNFTEQKYHERELKEEQLKENKEIEQTILPTIFSTSPSQKTETLKEALETITDYAKQKNEVPTKRNKWKGKIWAKYIPEFLGNSPNYENRSHRMKENMIKNYLHAKLGIIKINPSMIRKFKDAIYWQNYKTKYQPVKVKESKRKYQLINWNKIALTWASLTPKPKKGIFLTKAIGYPPNFAQHKRFEQELDAVISKKIPIKQNNRLNYYWNLSEPKRRMIYAKPKQIRIKRNWIQLATKYIDEKFLNPNLTITEFCRKEFGKAGGMRFMKLKKTLDQITTFKKQITESIVAEIPTKDLFPNQQVPQPSSLDNKQEVTSKETSTGSSP